MRFFKSTNWQKPLKIMLPKIIHIKSYTKGLTEYDKQQIYINKTITHRSVRIWYQRIRSQSRMRTPIEIFSKVI